MILQKNGVFPKPLLIEIDNKQVTVVFLSEVYPWTQFDDQSFTPRILAVSPSGKNIAATVRNIPSSPTTVLIYDGFLDKMVNLGQYSPTWSPSAVWQDDSIVRVITPEGVIEYNVPDQTRSTLVSADILETRTMYELIITPDGKYLFLYTGYTERPKQRKVLMYTFSE